MTDPIRAEAIRTLYAQIRTMFAATLVITAYMAATAAPFTDWQPIAIWATVVLLNQGLRLLLVRAFNRAAAPDSDLDRWARYYTAQQGLTGVIWAASMVLFAHPDQPVTIALTLSCLYSIAGAFRADSSALRDNSRMAAPARDSRLRARRYRIGALRTHHAEPVPRAGALRAGGDSHPL